MGERDTAVQQTEATLFCEGIEQAEMVVIEDTDHVCFMEKPDVFDQVVLDFLAGVTVE